MVLLYCLGKFLNEGYIKSDLLRFTFVCSEYVQFHCSRLAQLFCSHSYSYFTHFPRNAFPHELYLMMWSYTITIVGSVYNGFKMCSFLF